MWRRGTRGPAVPSAGHRSSSRSGAPPKRRLPRRTSGAAPSREADKGPAAQAIWIHVIHFKFNVVQLIPFDFHFTFQKEPPQRQSPRPAHLQPSKSLSLPYLQLLSHQAAAVALRHVAEAQAHLVASQLHPRQPLPGHRPFALLQEHLPTLRRGAHEDAPAAVECHGAPQALDLHTAAQRQAAAAAAAGAGAAGHATRQASSMLLDSRAKGGQHLLARLSF